MTGYSVAVLGAAGAVGQQILRVLEESEFPVASLKLLATSRSAGQKISFRDEDIIVEETTPGSFEGVDLAFFCASKDASLTLAPEAVKRGTVVIDKSIAFRLVPEVPLAIPEVNPEAIHRHQGIIASPNCSTIQMLVALKPLHDVSRIKRVIVSTYQAVSGSGREAMEELREQSRVLLDGGEARPVVYPHQIAFNLIPHIDRFEETGYSLEEMKLVRETRKIFNDPDIEIVPTAVRVPVWIGHAESIHIETEGEISMEEARSVLSNAPGVEVVDDPFNNRYPMPLDAAGSDLVYVGRIRKDLYNPKGLLLWVVSDNLRKGAATNAVQIARYVIDNGLLLSR